MDVKISLPLLPLRDIVVFPSMVIPLFVGRDKSISALNDGLKSFKGSALFSSHDHEFINTIANHIVEGRPPFDMYNLVSLATQ